MVVGETEIIILVILVNLLFMLLSAFYLWGLNGRIFRLKCRYCGKKISRRSPTIDEEHNRSSYRYSWEKSKQSNLSCSCPKCNKLYKSNLEYTSEKKEPKYKEQFNEAKNRIFDYRKDLTNREFKQTRDHLLKVLKVKEEQEEYERKKKTKDIVNKSLKIKLSGGKKMGIFDEYNGIGWKELLAGGVVGYFAGNKKASKKIAKQVKEHVKDFLEETNLLEDEEEKPKSKKKKKKK